MKLFQVKAVAAGILIVVAFQNCSKAFLSSGQQTVRNENSSNATLELTSSLGGPQVLTIGNSVFGSNLQIQAHDNFAYSIFSLTFRGKEFINSDDHGRELQSASSFDGYGECFNPTEAGSRDDGDVGGPSTSQVIGYYVSGNVLATKTDMAFWLHGNQAYPEKPYCGSHKDIHNAVNTTDRGNHIFEKNVKIGYEGLENVIDYNVAYHVPEAHQSATFEALTGYMPADFDHFFTYDPNSRSLIQILPAASPPPDGEQSLPLILSTSDRGSAMGVYSPELPQSIANEGYGHFSLPGTNKWNCVFRENNLSANSTYNYRCFVIVGTVEEVRLGIDKLHAKFHPSIPINVPPISIPSAPVPIDAGIAPGICTPAEYLIRRPDVAAAHLTAINHYNMAGKSEGMCQPIDGSGTCTSAEYLIRRPDVAAAHLTAINHYNMAGKSEGMCQPIDGGPGVCTAAEYLIRRPDVAAAHLTAINHYNIAGKNEGMCQPQ